MSFRTTLAAAVALSAAALILAPVSATVPNSDRATKMAGHGFSYDIGSKHTAGYFTAVEGACALTLMVSERVDPDLVTPTAGARVRVTVPAGQNALLETGEGAGVAVTCAEDAASISVLPLPNGA